MTGSVAHTGFGPRAVGIPHGWFGTSPRRIQGWRKVNEMPDRELMRATAAGWSLPIR